MEDRSEWVVVDVPEDVYSQASAEDLPHACSSSYCCEVEEHGMFCGCGCVQEAENDDWAWRQAQREPEWAA